MSLQQVLQPTGWKKPRGFSNGVKAKGTLVFTGGQIGWDSACCFASLDLAEQVRQTLSNVLAILAVAGAGPEHVVRLTWYITDKREYLARSKEIGAAYRAVMGNHYPAMAVVQVAELVEDAAKVEIEATAVIPDAD
jgi:enamine deaminase RidA (YjgF/YER057c/UK114 family)